MSVTEIEIQDIPPLSAGESCLLEMHSLLNAMNVLRGELAMLGFHLANDDYLLRGSLEACDTFTANLSDPVASERDARELPHFRQQIDSAIAQALAQYPAQAASADVQESVENIQSVFSILAARAAEILARRSAPGEWARFSVEEIQRPILEVFAAIEKNSHGRYRIVYNPARQERRDYYVDLTIESEEPGCLTLPPVFTDVVCDLLANARKYTPQGGTISAGIYESGKVLRLVVSDTGRGIPPEEIETVVHYGRRGSNVSQIRTMGGGFGLTKAFWVTKRFGGRFWIRSGLDAGTRITVEIPRPEMGGRNS